MLYKGFESHWFHCSSEVPQGSNLGPMFFLLLMNGITDSMRFSTSSSSILLYADNMKLFCPIHTIEDTAALQRDLDSLAAWSKKNLLPFNVEKSEKITLTRGTTNVMRHIYIIDNSLLKNVDAVGDLGI